MILGPITLVDCAAFVLFLIPQLLIQVNILSLVWVICKVLPFLCQLSSPWSSLTRRPLS